MSEFISQLQANNTFSYIHEPFKRVLCCAERPRFGYSEKSTEGCFGGSVVIGGYRRVTNGIVSIGGLKLTNERLHDLEGLYICLTAKDLMCGSYGILGVPQIS